MLRERGPEILPEKFQLGTLRFDLDRGVESDHWFVAIEQGRIVVARENRPADCVAHTDERWSGDVELVRLLEGEARAALNWIDSYGDLLGNGYVWYQRRNTDTGLENQCWKDSWDGISYRDGRLPDFPRATCELQGYAYDAKVRGARLARLVWGDPVFADHRVGVAAVRFSGGGGSDRGGDGRREAQYFHGRLPEAFAGYDRELTKYPVQYPTACSPQAWSAGTPLLLVRTMLGLEPQGERLVVDPAVPEHIGRIELLDIPGRWGHVDAFGRPA